MNSRERVLKAISRQVPDRVPIYLWLAPHLEEKIRKEWNVENVEDYLKLDIRFVVYASQPEESDFSPYTKDFPKDVWLDAWGVGYQSTGFYHLANTFHPMKDFTTIEEVKNYPFPQRLPDLKEMRKHVRAIQDRGLAACAQYERGPWEKAFYLMGMEQLMLNMYSRREMVEFLLDRISDVNARIAAAYVEAGVDIIWFGDDLGGQRGPLMNPDMWRKFVKPNDKKVIEAVRKVSPDIPIAFHSCGAVMWAVEDLIEIGVNCLQSIQPEANDTGEIKRRYGDRISFWGGVSSQSTLSLCSPEDVKKEVRHLIATMGKDGGYICASSHVVEPEAPLENIHAFLATIEEHGYYE